MHQGRPVGAGRRVELIERLPLDARRSVALIRRDGREHLILLGPEGGVKGGEIVAVGTPEQVVKEPRSYTGKYLAPLLKGRGVEAEAAE